MSEKYFTIVRNDVGMEAYRDQYVYKLEKENQRLADANEAATLYANDLSQEKGELLGLLRWCWPFAKRYLEGCWTYEGLNEKKQRIQELVEKRDA